MSANNSIYLLMMLNIKQDHMLQFQEFKKGNELLLQSYNIAHVKTIAIALKGQLAGQNDLPQPDFISIFKVASMAQFMDYVADERYKSLAGLREQATSSVTGYFAHAEPLPEALNSTSIETDRLYIVGLANFIDQDATGLESFNQKAIAQGLFETHGMHVEQQLSPFKVVNVVGNIEVTLPDRIQIFFVDNPDNMKNYIADPTYKALAPLRDTTLVKYDFFAGAQK